MPTLTETFVGLIESSVLFVTTTRGPTVPVVANATQGESWDASADYAFELNTSEGRLQTTTV